MARISFVGTVPVEHEQIVRNMDYCKSLNLPQAEMGCNKRDGRLAVVGGGPSVLQHLDAIRECSEVWAINGACGLLRGHGIDSWLFAVDPHPIVAKWAVGASKALLCNRVDPSVFDVLKGAEVKVYEIRADNPDGVYTGGSTATVAFHLGVEAGFTHIDFFGCESSFEDKTHAYQDEKREHLLWVECGGKEYKTAPDFYIQAEEMSNVIRVFPSHFRHFGGGLLQAMIDNKEHDITHASRALMESLTPA